MIARFECVYFTTAVPKIFFYHIWMEINTKSQLIVSLLSCSFSNEEPRAWVINLFGVRDLLSQFPTCVRLPSHAHIQHPHTQLLACMYIVILSLFRITIQYDTSKNNVRYLFTILPLEYFSIWELFFFLIFKKRNCRLFRRYFFKCQFDFFLIFCECNCFFLIKKRLREKGCLLKKRQFFS